MIVISTIRASQFQDDSQIKSPGTKCLKHFLKFAEDSSFNTKNGHDVDNSSLLYYIKMDLQMKGFVVDTNVGNSEFKVDLALRNKDSDHYELGVIIDTKPIDNEISCRDKFYVQESVLNAMKWKTIHIYSIEYFKDPILTIERIVNAYNEEYKKYSDAINYSVEHSKGIFFRNDYDVVEYNVPKPNLDGRFCAADTTVYIINYIKELINNLSPISYNELKKQLENSNILSSYELKRLKELLNMHFYENRSFEVIQYFYWRDSNRTVEKFRYANGRSIEDIAREEIICAMKKVIELFGKKTEDELYFEVMKAFNFESKKITPEIRGRLEYVYAYAKEKGEI